jgi:hypothetical protein
MKIKKVKRQIAIFVVGVALIPALFNPQSVIQQAVKLNNLSGKALQMVGISSILAIAGLTISRLIYREKNTEKVIKISLSSFLLNILHLILFLMGSLYVANRLDINFSSNTGLILAVTMLVSLVNTVFLEKFLGELNDRSSLKQEDLEKYFSKKFPKAISLLYILLIASLGSIAYMSPALRPSLVWAISFVIWQSVYVYFVNPTLISDLI